MEAPQFFNFCPSCNSTHFQYADNFKFHCHDCDFVLYHNIAAAVAVIFTFQDAILFTVRNQEPDKGKWDLPGGFCDPDETAEQAACREVAEELGLQLTPSDLTYVASAQNRYLYRGVLYRTMDLFFECSLTDDRIGILAQDEIQSLLWVKRSAIVLDQIGFQSIRNVVAARYL